MTLPAPAPQAPKKPTRPSDRFVAYVHELCESKGTRAALRKGLGLPVERCNYLHRYLVPWMPERVHPDAKRAHYAVAALIAARPRTARDAPTMRPTTEDEATHWYQRANLGAALGQAVNKKVLKPATAESALHLMSRQSTDAIHPGLPALTRQLLRDGIDVDWAVLLEDLAWWNRARDQIATRWLESYFRITSAPQAADHDLPPETPAPSEENNS
ncbi:type I-E CRISPR-associated protein Cse2/CasB [Streptomyces krungchingensis]